MHGISLLETRDLQFRYGRHDVLKKVNLSVPKGSIYGFLGKNGAGKSTTIKLLLGLERATRGNILFEGVSFNYNKLKNYAAIGSLIEAPSPYGHLSAFENLRYLDFLYQIGLDRIVEVLQLVKLSGQEHKRVDKFSMGMKQRLGIAMAILSNPALLVLDEPFNGLDPEGVWEMRELLLDLQRNGKTIFFSSHILSEVQKISTHIGFLHEGQVVFQGPMSDLLSTVVRMVTLRTSDQTAAYAVCTKNHLQTTILAEGELLVEINNDAQFDLLIRALVNADVHLFSVKTADPSLEDVFIKLTRPQEYA